METVGRVRDVDEPDARARFLRGWSRAAREAAIAAAIGLAIGEVVSLLALAGGGVLGLGLDGALKGGVVLFLLFHHVGLEARMESLSLPHHAEVPLALPSGYAVDGTIALAFLGGTALVLWLLARAGATLGELSGQRPRDRGLRGMQVAVPYGLITWGLAWLVHGHVRFAGMPALTVEASHISSLMWPLVLAAAAGFAGGVRSGPGGAWQSDWWEAEIWSRRWAGAFAGAARILAIGMALALVGFLVLAVVRLGDTAQYAAAAFSGGPVAGLGVVALGVLALPNAALWILAPAFGGCVQIASGFGIAPYCAISYTHVPSHPLAQRDVYWGLPQLGPPPAPFWLFLLVPVVAVVAGALLGVRRSGARSGREGALVGALTGLVFTGLLLAALVLATVSVRLRGPLSYVGAGFFRYGPQPFDAIELGVGWGMIGGALVGWLAGRRRGRSGRGELRLGQGGPSP